MKEPNDAIGETVAIKFQNETCNDKEYWDNLRTIEQSDYFPETGVIETGKEHESVRITEGTILSVEDGYANVSFKDGREEKILQADLEVMP